MLATPAKYFESCGNGYGALRKVKVRFAGHGEKTFIADKVTLEIVRKG